MSYIDNTCVWMPYTQMKTAPEPLRVASGSGVMLTLEDGREIMDCISSWWVNLHGHGQPDIANAIYEQAMRLEQVITAGLTHEPAEMLARSVASKLPGDLNWVFYTDDGSTAVESAVKMGFQYWKNKGVSTRTRLLSFENAYHGDTLGAMSVSQRSVFTDPFKELMFDVDPVPFPGTFMGDDHVEERESNALAALDRLIEQNPDRYAAMIMEPMIQGAGGINMCRPEYLKALEKRLKQAGILVIYDEVMTGFGRTGEWFACQKAGTTPDIVCLSKGITGGFLPLAATVATDEVFKAFYDDDPKKTLFHGHSYTANPLGCAAGNASFKLMLENEHLFKGMSAWHEEFIQIIADHPRIEKPRICGTIAAFDIVGRGETGYLNEVGPVLKKAFMEKGFLLRPLGNVLYLLPPYCITKNQLLEAYTAIKSVLDTL